MSEQKKWDEMSRKERITGFVGLIVIALVAVWIISAVVGAVNNDTENSNVDATSQEETQNEIEEPEAAITENEAEVFCQDAALLDKYVNLDNVDIIDVWNYNSVFTEDIGDGVSSLQWNGKNKITDENILFICDISGSSDDIMLENLVIDGEEV